ncbi:MAG: tRNA lysidine(34) synthetase TilS [Lysobacterales bacterium]
MPVPLAESLRSALVRLPPGGVLHVGYSGGLDSTVLLHALAQLPAARARGLVALHVDHGLHPASAAWARHCCGTAAALGVEARVLPVQINRAGRGLEAAARAARHAALAAALPADGVLVLAHHADDQSETVLLKLLRGAGPEGLGGMRALRVLPQGWLWRPLLDLPRETLRGYALAQGLEWIEDPTNADLRHARNRLRHEILPALRRHWPPLDASLAHAARHAQAAADYIDEAARRALAELQGLDPHTLDWRGWLQLPAALRDPLLRQWLRALGLDEPTHLHVAELQRQLGDAAPERLPCVAFAATELRRYRDLLYARAARPDPPPGWERVWDGDAIDLPADCGRLALEALGGGAPAAASPAALHLRFRRGGERLRPAGDRHTRELRDLLQEVGVPPWDRPRLPLVYAGETLLAVADLWVTEAGAEWLGRRGLRLRWQPGAAAPRR